MKVHTEPCTSLQLTAGYPTCHTHRCTSAGWSISYLEIFVWSVISCFDSHITELRDFSQFIKQLVLRSQCFSSCTLTAVSKESNSLFTHYVDKVIQYFWFGILLQFSYSDQVSSYGSGMYLNKPAAQAAGQTLPNATPQVGKIHTFSKIAVTFEPIQRFRCPPRFRISEKCQ